MKRSWSLVPLVAALSVVLASPAFAKGDDEVVTAEKAADDSKDVGLGLSGSIVLDNSIGIGSFYRPDTTLFFPTLSLTGAWSVPQIDHVSMSAKMSFLLYGLADLDAGSSTDPDEQVRLSDLTLTFGHSKLFHDEDYTGLKLSGSLGVILPTSPTSQTATKIMGIGPAIALSRKFGFASLGVNAGYKYNWHRFTSAVIEPDKQEAGVIAGCVNRFASGADAPNLSAGAVACGGAVNREHSFSWGGSAGFSITKNLSASIQFVVGHSVGFERPVDEFTSEVSRRTNNENQSDSTIGIVDVSYQLNDHLAFSVGTFSQQTLYTSDTERIRFPWWDLEGPQSNRTSLYVDIAGSF